jgi:acyl carrier protein
MTAADIRTQLESLVKTKLRFEGSLNEGELAEQLDSVQRLTLVVAIEDHFEICFDPEDEEKIRGFDDLVSTIETKLATD